MYAVEAPRELKGAVLELDYSGAEFCTEVIDESNSGWVSFRDVGRNFRGAAEAFTTTAVGIKRTRRLLPITSPADRGIYTYRPVNGDIGELDIDMVKAYNVDAVRSISLRFISPTEALATEGVYHGNYIGTIRNIRVIIKPAVDKVDSSDEALVRLRRELQGVKYDKAEERRYQQKLVELLQRFEEGEPVTAVDADGKGCTALHYACELSNLELVKWLLAHGADVNARSASGAMATDCVCGPNAAAIRAELLRARARK